MDSDGESSDGGPPMQMHRTQTAPCTAVNYDFDLGHVMQQNQFDKNALDSDDDAPPVGFRRTVTLDPTVFFHERDLSQVSGAIGGDSDDELIGSRRHTLGHLQGVHGSHHDDETESNADSGVWSNFGGKKGKVSSRCFVCQAKVMVKDSEGSSERCCSLCMVSNGTLVNGAKGPTAVRIRSVTCCQVCIQSGNTRKAVQEVIEEPILRSDRGSSAQQDQQHIESFISMDGCLTIYVCVRLGGCWNRIRRRVNHLPKAAGVVDRFASMKSGRRLLNTGIPRQGMSLGIKELENGQQLIWNSDMTNNVQQQQQQLQFQQQQQQQQQQSEFPARLPLRDDQILCKPELARHGSIGAASFGGGAASSNMSLDKGSFREDLTNDSSSDDEGPPVQARRAVTLDPTILGSQPGHMGGVGGVGGRMDPDRPQLPRFKGEDNSSLRRQSLVNLMPSVNEMHANPPQPEKRVVSFAFGNRKKNRVSSRCFVCQKKVQMKNEHDVHNSCQLCSCESGAVVRGLKGPTSVTIRSITFCGGCMQTNLTRDALQSTIDNIVSVVAKDSGAQLSLSDFETDPISGSLKLYVCVRVGGCWSKIRCSHDLASSRITPQQAGKPADGSGEDIKQLPLGGAPQMSTHQNALSAAALRFPHLMPDLGVAQPLNSFQAHGNLLSQPNDLWNGAGPSTSTLASDEPNVNMLNTSPQVSPNFSYNNSTQASEMPWPANLSPNMNASNDGGTASNSLDLWAQWQMQNQMRQKQEKKPAAPSMKAPANHDTLFNQHHAVIQRQMMQTQPRTQQAQQQFAVPQQRQSHEQAQQHAQQQAQQHAQQQAQQQQQQQLQQQLQQHILDPQRQQILLQQQLIEQQKQQALLAMQQSQLQALLQNQGNLDPQQQLLLLQMVQNSTRTPTTNINPSMAGVSNMDYTQQHQHQPGSSDRH